MKDLRKIFKSILVLLLTAVLINYNITSAFAAPAFNLSYFKDMSDSPATGWPKYPEIAGEAAILMEATTGTILYQKNMKQKMYPASITKLLTTLLVLENCKPDEMVKFSSNAIFSLPPKSGNIAINPGEYLSVENCLYGMLLASANEVANALAEHVSGSVEEFVALMNKRAGELGAISTNCTNAHGLHDENHYTTCYDTATICRSLLQNKLFLKINGTASYIIPPTNLQPQKRPVNSTHKLLRSGALHYDGCIGGKTGYTDAAGNTLVTFAERNGITLICVVMKDSSSDIYTDSRALLDYGFDCFKKVNIAENETSFNFTGNLPSDNDSPLFHNPNPTLSLAKEDYVYIPINASFEDLGYTLKTTAKEDIFANLIYTYNGHYVGAGSLIIKDADPAVVSDDSPENEEELKLIVIKPIHIIIAGVTLLIIIIIIIYLKATRIKRMRKKAARRRK